MKFIDLFAGIGGFRLGMEMAGHECVGFCEIDKFAEKSYRAMYDAEGEWFADDIRTVDPRDMPDFDCLTGGFPCQSFSVAGKRGGFEDTRGTLFFEIARIIRERQPQLVFLENVKGLLNHDGGRTFGTILQTFWELGYDVEWQLLNSKDFGVPQNRERVFIIGYPRGTRRRKVLPITGTTSTNISKDVVSADYRYDEGLRIRENGTTPCLRARNEGMATNDMSNTVFIIDKKGKLKENNTTGQYASTLTVGGNSGGNHSDMDLIVQAVIDVNREKKTMNGRRIKENNEPMFTLTAQDRHGVMISEATKKGYDIATQGDSINLAVPGSKTRRGRVGKGVANTLDTSCNQGVLSGTRIRRLTPRECFRLQGFPDRYFDRAREVNSDSQLYKQAGNSVTVNVIYEIARRL